MNSAPVYSCGTSCLGCCVPHLFQLLGEPWNIPVFGDSKIINPHQGPEVRHVGELTRLGNPKSAGTGNSPGYVCELCAQKEKKNETKEKRKESKKELLCSKLLGLFLWKVLKILTQEDGDNSSRAHPKLICVSVVRRHCGREMMTLCQHRASWAPAECFSCEFSLVLKCLKFCNATFNF